MITVSYRDTNEAISTKPKIFILESIITRSMNNVSCE